MIIASIPNVMYYSVLMSLLDGCWDYEAGGIVNKDHIRYFTYKEIVSLFSQGGYTIEQIVSNKSMPAEAEKEKVGEIINIIDEKLREQVFVIQYIVSAKI